MNILIIGACYLSEALRRLGQNVLTASSLPYADLGLSNPQTWKGLGKKLEAINFSPSLTLFADDGNLPLLIDPENIPGPSAFFSVDTYCNPWHVPYARAFDLTYVAQKDFLPLFLEDGQDARWFPLFCRADSTPDEAPRDIPVSFVGTIGHKNNPQREPFLRKFNKYQPLEILSGDFKPIFSRSQIALNQTAFCEINFRCFEAMALGAALLMEKCDNGFEELFTPGVNILPPFTKNNAREAAKIASIYLKSPQALREIAERGRELVMANHTDLARAASLLKDAEKLFAMDKEKRAADFPGRKASAATAFAMIASELTDDGMSVYRDFFYKVARTK